jgi:LysR family transcriptional regulator of gallate degradation
LRNGSIDFFLSQPFEAEQHGLDFEILYSDRLAVCARPGHPLAKEAHAEVAELAGFEWALIRDQMSGAAEDQLMKVFLENGMPPPKVTLESDSAPLVYATIANTDLLCLRPVPVGQMHTRIGGLVEIATPPIFPRLTRGLTYRNPSGLDSTATAMVRVIKEVSTGFSGDRPTDTAGSLPA